MIDFLLSGLGRIVVGAIGGAVGAGLAAAIGGKLKWSTKVNTVVIGAAAVLFGTGLPRIVSHFAEQEKISVMVDEGLDKGRAILAKANEAEDGDAVLVSESRKAIDEALQKLDAKGKVKYAANEYWAFYFVVTIARAEYCAKQGAPIDSFVNEVKRRNKLDTDAAASIVSQEEAEALYRTHVLSKQIRDVEAMHQSMAQQYEVPVQRICQVFQDDSVEASKEFKYSELMPQVSHILRTATN